MKGIQPPALIIERTQRAFPLLYRIEEKTTCARDPLENRRGDRFTLMCLLIVLVMKYYRPLDPFARGLLHTFVMDLHLFIRHLGPTLSLSQGNQRVHLGAESDELEDRYPLQLILQLAQDLLL